MARLPDNIRSIDGSKETLKLEIRIADLWFVGASDRSEQAEMIVIDSNADDIHVVVRKDQLKSWKSILKEGSAYVMHNFKVIRNEGQYRGYSHFSCHSGNTVIEILPDSSVVTVNPILDDLPLFKQRLIEAELLDNKFIKYVPLPPQAAQRPPTTAP